MLAVTPVLPRETEEAGTPGETAAAEVSHSLSDQAALVGHFWAKKKKIVSQILLPPLFSVWA